MDNFRHTKKLGQGGFGPVYKRTLDDGKEIAVKRLSKASGQGLEAITSNLSKYSFTISEFFMFWSSISLIRHCPNS
ncbi:hypothetical protein V6Z12_A01G035200 [Gossypium hirsutum]